MKKQSLLGLVLLAMTTIASAADEAAEKTGLDAFGAAIDSGMKSIFGWFPDLIFTSVPVGESNIVLVAVWLLVAALIFTLYFGFIQFRHFGLAIDIVRGKYTDPNKKTDGEVSHFQALTTALSATVGLGNIAGVGAAVAIGGAGATVWMILIGLLGMASKFVECTLGVKYRSVNADGTVSGGPMHYLEKGFAEKGMGGFGKFLAFCFAVMCILGSLGGGNMFQGNQSFSIAQTAFGIPQDYSLFFGIAMAVFVGAIILGGMKRIGNATSKIVPFMAAMYVGMSLIVIGSNIEQVPAAFAHIFNSAFTGEGVVGGMIGALIAGLQRAVFSNEAGIGSAAIAHSAVQTDEPATEGLVALLEPFIDTVIICTMTALVITISGVNTLDNMKAVAEKGEGALSGIDLTGAAFAQTSEIFVPMLAIAAILFALSTMISWCYYGVKACTYLFGESKAVETGYKIVFCVFIVIGTIIHFDFVLGFSDAAIFAMCIFNIIGLYFLMPVVKKEVNSFIARVKSGEIKKYK